MTTQQNTSVTPTPLEAALRIAYEIHGQQAADDAKQEADRATERVERQRGQNNMDWGGWLGMMRASLKTRDKAVATHHHLAALAAGEPPEPLPTGPDVNAELLARYVVAKGPSAFTELVTTAANVARHVQAEADKMAERLEVVKRSYADGAHNVTTAPVFVASAAENITQHRGFTARAERLRKAVQTAQDALRRIAPEVLGNLSDLKAGLRESGLLARKADPEFDMLVRSLDSIDADLAALGLDGGDKREPGRIGAELMERRRDVAGRIKARRKESIAKASNTAADLAERAMLGDPSALAEIVGIIKAQPLAFAPKLDEAIVAGMAEALSESADVFTELLLPG